MSKKEEVTEYKPAKKDLITNTYRVTPFIGCESDFENSEIVLFGAGFDGTTTYRPGTRFAPTAIRRESYAIETYSPYQDKELSDIKVFDAGDLELPFGKTERVLSIIEQATTDMLEAGKFPLMLGGEHLVTLGAFRAIVKKYPKIVIMHFDAHTDLRNDYMGEPLSHSTVIRRLFDIVGKGRIYQFGIRSGERVEFEFAQANTHLVKHNFYGLEQVIKKIGRKTPVYFTIDLDVLDPAEFAGTGTPEAGGVKFLELLDAARKTFELNVVGCDITELSPPYDQSGASTALACKFLREILLMIKGDKK